MSFEQSMNVFEYICRQIHTMESSALTMDICKKGCGGENCKY